MAVAKRPKKAKVDDFINEAEKTSTSKNDGKKILLRISDDLLADVDAQIESERTGQSRNSWILQAVVEKLKRSED